MEESCLVQKFSCIHQKVSNTLGAVEFELSEIHESRTTEISYLS